MVKFAYKFSSPEYVKLLLHLRWLVFIVAIPMSLVIEVIEGRSTDLQFLDEVIIDGLVLPISSWIVLTFVAKKVSQQLEREQILEQQQLLMQNLTEFRGYRELINFLVRFPSTLMPVEQVSLFVENQARGQLNLAAEWNLPNSAIPLTPHTLTIHPVCRVCLSDTTAPAHIDEGCSVVLAQHSEFTAREFRIELIHEDQQIGIMRLICQPGKVTTDRIQDLTAFAPEIARAMALAIEDMRETERMYHEAQVYERRRITQEIHDSLAQQVFYLHLGIDQLSDDLSPLVSEKIRRKLNSMRNVSADVYDQIRNNLSILRAWEQVNLTEAITDLARITARNAEFSIDIDVQGEASWLSPHSCEHFFGIVRKALQNIERHARAGHVTLKLIWSLDQLSFYLTDDGIGFDPLKVPTTEHYGLALIREAVDALHGTFILESAPGSGTHISISMPLQPIDTTLNLQTRNHAELALSF
jgi:signal transduction histidine kinase